MPKNIRKGRQEPTLSVILPYTKSRGRDAVATYNKTGRKAQDWQKLLIYDMLAVNDEGLWVHTKFGYSVPRRNGKNEVVAMRELYGLKKGEHILHTAHRTTTTHSAWERLIELLEKSGTVITSSYRAYGKEHIEVEGGGKVEFRTRTSKGGLGEGFDLLIIDEAQEYQDDQESALKYVVSDSKNPQTIFTGTPPTPVSSGVIFKQYRDAVLMGGTENSGWAEWSVEHETDPRDREAWYETNPSLGSILTERKITDEIGSDRIDFNIQRLGLWIRYNQKSAISPVEWEELRCKDLPQLTGKLFVGIKYGHTGERVSLSVAARTSDKRIFIECYDCVPIREGNAWILDFLRAAKGSISRVIVDGQNGQQLLSDEMKDSKLRPPELPTVKQIITASSAFEQGLFSGTICHAGQPSFVQAVSNCEKRAIGSGGGFGYRSTREEVEIAILDSAVLAYWAASESRVVSKQRIRY